MSQRLSILAQLVLLYAEKGISRTCELAAITGKTRRTIQRAKNEIRAANCDTSVAATPMSHIATPVSHVSVRNSDTHVASENYPSPLKKKGLPHTPSKEKTNPPPRDLVERSPNPTIVEQAAVPAAAQNLELASEQSDAGSSADEHALEQDAARIGIRAMPLAACVKTYGHSVAKAAVTRIAGKENIRDPNALLARICEDVVADRAKGRRDDFVPIGAIDLGNGHYASRWGGR